MRWPWQPREEKAQFEDALQRLIASQEGLLDGWVTPESCMQSPTVHAIVTAISRRLSVTPVHVYRKGMSQGRESKERLPSHPVARLLRQPNEWQSRHDFWQDAASTFVRWGRFYAYKSRGTTGPIRELIPLEPRSVELKQDEKTYRVVFKVSEATGAIREYSPTQMLHARGPARNFLEGNSPVSDCKQAIAVEILAEKFGAAFFENGAVPLLIFRFAQGSAGFKTEEQEKRFVAGFQEAFGGNKRHRAMLLPKGFEEPTPMRIDHDKAQFLETRKYQRTVIAGAFGVPPHLVGDLERATFNNVEQQDQDFTQNVILPVAQAFEAAMERDLLTDIDRRDGVVIRFNLDSTLRADFKSRQEGLWRQRQSGVISANEWREIEGMNPLSDEDGGNDYLNPANMNVAGEEPIDDETTPDSITGNQSPR